MAPAFASELPLAFMPAFVPMLEGPEATPVLGGTGAVSLERPAQPRSKSDAQSAARMVVILLTYSGGASAAPPSAGAAPSKEGRTIP
jgi:hypothetical protein